MELETCPNCRVGVVVSPDGRCPDCQGQIAVIRAGQFTNPYQPPTAPAEARPQPVTVKAYGLIPITRKAYLTLQVVLLLALAVVLIALRAIVAPGRALGMVDAYLVYFFLFVMAVEGVETAIMLSKFKKAERERARQLHGD